MRIVFDSQAWDDFLRLQSDNPKLWKKLNRLIAECQRTPFEGIGKPEPLKYKLAGCWSRRIDDHHRLVYRVNSSGDSDALEIISCKGHY